MGEEGLGGTMARPLEMQPVRPVQVEAVEAVLEPFSPVVAAVPVLT